MDVAEAREKIYIPMYRWMLEQKVLPIIQRLREIAQQCDIVLLDDSINCDINSVSQPLSHAWLIKSYVEGNYPYEDVYGIRKVNKVVMVGQHMYYTIKEVKCLKEIKSDCIGGNCCLVYFVYFVYWDILVYFCVFWYILVYSAQAVYI